MTPSLKQGKRSVSFSHSENKISENWRLLREFTFIVVEARIDAGQQY